MANWIRTDDPHGFNKGHSSKFREGSRVRQTPEEGLSTYRPKRGNNNKDEDNSPKTLNDKNYQASEIYFYMLYTGCSRNPCFISNCHFVWYKWTWASGNGSFICLIFFFRLDQFWSWLRPVHSVHLQMKCFLKLVNWQLLHQKLFMLI